MTDQRRNSKPPSPLAELPAIHRVLAIPELKTAVEAIPPSVTVRAARSVLDRIRRELLAEGAESPVPDTASIAAEVARAACALAEQTLRSAINATGILLHTGLGRARLSNAACDAMLDVAQGHSTLEIDAETGRRGSRREHVRGLLRELTGAEDAAVVNNCAAAVLLAVTVIANGREVIISRGEIVEIGGAFRMPDIIRASGAGLVEVGTTNRTRISDFAAAINENTGLILRCHPSNFAIVGFTESAPMEELARLGHDRGIPVMDDQGSGALITPGRMSGMANAGSLQSSIAAGCDIVTASGDKLLGGPQAGILLGRSSLLERIASHPLSRALRIDKFTLAALEATLRLYREPSRAAREIPTLRYLNREPAELDTMAKKLASHLATALGERFQVSLLPSQSQVGGGSLPGENLPTMCVAIQSRSAPPSADAIATHFRRHSPPIFTRIQAGAVLLDPRTLELAEFDPIAEAARGLARTT